MARFDFKRRRGRVGQGPPSLGLIVPLRALLMFDDKRNVVYDELRERENSYRKLGRAPVVFEEDETADEDWRS
jgi:hypothetical protein